MKYSTTPIALIALSLGSKASARDPKCGFFQIPDWICDVCGGYSADTPIVCSPFNATFDDLPPGKPVGIYKSTNWANFNTVAGSTSNPAPHLQPFSKPNYARLSAGKTGVLTFGFENGTDPGIRQLPIGNLYSYHFGCALPSTPAGFTAVPAPCTVHFTAACAANSMLSDGNFTEYEWDVSYAPVGRPDNGTLAFHQGDPPLDDHSAICSNYTVAAKGTYGLPVDFVWDEVIYRTFSQGIA